MPGKSFIEIVEYATNKVERQFDITKMTPSERAKLEAGLIRKLDHDRFFLRNVKPKKKAAKGKGV